MKTSLYFLLVGCLIIPPYAAAEDSVFVDTSEAIVEQLTTPQDFGLTRSFVIVEDAPTRAVTVRLKEQGRKEDKEILVGGNSPVGVARLKVEFDTNSSRLRSESYEILDQLGIALGDVRVAGRQVCIKGHTDSDGSDGYNLSLSYDRAEAVREYVVSRYNLEQAQLFIVGYGEQMPLVANNSASDKQKNRRVEITLGCPEVSAVK